jgi:hypothetical protein
MLCRYEVPTHKSAPQKVTDIIRYGVRVETDGCVSRHEATQDTTHGIETRRVLTDIRESWDLIVSRLQNAS